MSKGIFRNTKNAKANRFLLFLLLATIFWILTKFSREFTATMTAKINYENIPETAALSANNAKKITFDLTANGFEILFYKFKKPNVTVSVGTFYTKENGGFTISKTELLRLVSENFNRNLSIKNLSIEELKVHLDPIVLKKVKVIAKTDFTFKNGFKPIDSIKIVPDSVQISGPSGALKNIDRIQTELISLEGVEQTISESAKLISPGEAIVSIKPKKVQVELRVAEFSQGQFTFPVEVVNLPPNVEIRMVPQSVTLTFDASVKDFPSISKENFRVVCDFSKGNKGENFMIPFLEKRPKNVYNVVFEPKKIDFFILK